MHNQAQVAGLPAAKSVAIEKPCDIIAFSFSTVASFCCSEARKLGLIVRAAHIT